MRLYRHAVLALAVCLSFSGVVAGQQSSAPGAQAISTLLGSLKALVGQSVISDVTITATAHRIAGSDDEIGTATLTAMSAGESKLSMNLTSGTFIETRTPVGGPPPGAPPETIAPAGMWLGPDGVTHSIATQNIVTDPTWFLPAFTIGRLTSSTNYVPFYVGPETHNGQQVAHVSVSQQFWLNVSGQAPIQASALFQHLSQMDLYLDPTTLLPVELDFEVHPDNNALADIPVQITFSNYGAVNGVQVPFHVRRYLNGSLALDLEFTSVAFNSGLTAASFAVD
jgi:hypothetical protein